MALRNQPYIPLYVNDFSTDEKLIECSAEATGVYIRIMCLMHKSEEYGKILLKQKYKQHANQVKNLASQIVRNLPYSIDVVERSLNELIEEKVLHFDGNYLTQKRMIKDNDISEKRASAGKIGGDATQKKSDKNKGKFAKANKEASKEANTVNEYVIESEDENKEKKDGSKNEIPTLKEFGEYAISKKPNLDKESVKFKYDAWVENGWKDGNDKPIKNWKSKLLQTIPHLKESTQQDNPNRGGSPNKKAL